MKSVCLLFLLQLHLQQVTSDLRYDHCAYWTYSKGFGLPEYTERRVLNDVTIFYHDSTLKSKMPCPHWLNTTAGKEHWKIIHHWSDYNRDVFTLGYQSAVKQFNHTGSLTDKNIYQVSGCCSLYPNGTYTALMTHGFNGRNFLNFDVNTKTFVVTAPEAFVYKTLREKDPVTLDEIAAFYKTTCLERLKILKQAPGVNIRQDIRYDSCGYWMYSKGFRLPEYTERRFLNDVTVYLHNSTSKSKMPCPDWINTTAGKMEWGDIHFWSDINRELFEVGFRSASQQFNLTGFLSDRNIYQGFGCCSLYPNGTYTAFMNHAFNGKDFTSFDIKTKTFVAAVPQAVRYKTLRESEPSIIDEVAEFYGKNCLNRLKILQQAPGVHIRKVPEVQILQQKQKKTGSVTVTCHVTGFYPREIQVFWLGSDLQSVDEGVTEVLPNGDGTYQTRKSVIVPEEDVGKQNYSCVVLHISVPKNITTVWGVEQACGAALWTPLTVSISLLVSGIGLCVWWLRKNRGSLLQFLSQFPKNASSDEDAPSTSSNIDDEDEGLKETASSGTTASTSRQIECAPFLSTEQDAVI